MMAEEEKTRPARQKKLQTYSSVERLINAWGYKLKMELVSPDDQETSIVVIDHPTEKRLAFLERAIAEAGRGEIKKQLGIGNTTGR